MGKLYAKRIAFLERRYFLWNRKSLYLRCTVSRFQTCPPHLEARGQGLCLLSPGQHLSGWGQSIAHAWAGLCRMWRCWVHHDNTRCAASCLLTWGGAFLDTLGAAVEGVADPHYPLSRTLHALPEDQHLKLLLPTTCLEFWWFQAER